MSGRWDWDVKSSYTYHALKKAKDVVAVSYTHLRAHET